MKPNFRTLANIGISQLTPYQPGKPIAELERELGISASIKMASNENPLGVSPKALAAMRLALEDSHIYPDGSGFELKQALSQIFGIEPNQITLGNGSENVLEIIGKAYLNEYSSAVISQYAFLTIPLIIQSFGATTLVAPAVNWGHNVDNILNAIQANTKMIFIVNPNNPTGTYTHQADLIKLLNAVPPHVLVVLDEAYNEFIDAEDYPSALSFLKTYPNLIISRTFSKAYGLAGARVGFSISSPEIADILNRARLPFNVNSLAMVGAIAALNDVEHIKNTVTLNKRGMLELQNGLKALNLAYIPSVGNFITVEVNDGLQVYQQLLHHGVIVRPLKAYDMPKHIRVTIGTSEHNSRFLTAIQAVMSKQKESV